MKAEYEANNPGIRYLSLREMMSEFEDSDDPYAVKNVNFKTSFRIIAKQNSIKQSGRTFSIEPDFDVEYTIESPPEYQHYLEQTLKL